jgi:hypothetical protein
MYKKPFALGVIILFLLSSLIPMVSSYTPTFSKTIYVDDDGADYTRIQDAIENVCNIKYDTYFCYLFIGFIYNLKTLKYNDIEIIYVFNCFSVIVIGWKEGFGIDISHLEKGESYVLVDSNYPNFKSDIKGYIGERFIGGIMYGGLND